MALKIKALIFVSLIMAVAHQLMEVNLIKPYSSTAKEQDHRQEQEKQYLYYFTHSGWSNQIIGLQRAAQIAMETNRTLILPPILPHDLRDKPLLFPQWESRKGNSPNCKWYKNHRKFQNLIVEDANKFLNPSAEKIGFPSLTELIDFSQLTQHVEIIDLPDFMTSVGKRRYQSQFGLWDLGKENHLDLDGRCTIQKTRNYTDMIQLFNENYDAGDDKIVAVIGSAFNIGNSFEQHNPPLGRVMNDFFHNYPPTPKLLRLIKLIYKKLPQDYAGVHIRFPDNAKLDNCNSDKNMATIYGKLLSTLRNQTMHQNRGEITRVLIGRSHPNAKACFNAFAQKSNSIFRAITVNDIIEEIKAADVSKSVGGSVKSWMDEIKVERNTLYLVLDQMLLGLAKKIVLDVTAFRARSSFQAFVNLRHERRGEWLNLHMTEDAKKSDDTSPAI